MDAPPSSEEATFIVASPHGAAAADADAPRGDEIVDDAPSPLGAAYGQSGATADGGGDAVSGDDGGGSSSADVPPPPSHSHSDHGGLRAADGSPMTIRRGGARGGGVPPIARSRAVSTVGGGPPTIHHSSSTSSPLTPLVPHRTSRSQTLAGHDAIAAAVQAQRRQGMGEAISTALLVAQGLVQIGLHDNDLAVGGIAAGDGSGAVDGPSDASLLFHSGGAEHQQQLSPAAAAAARREARDRREEAMRSKLQLLLYGPGGGPLLAGAAAGGRTSRSVLDSFLGDASFGASDDEDDGRGLSPRGAGNGNGGSAFGGGSFRSAARPHPLENFFSVNSPRRGRFDAVAAASPPAAAVRRGGDDAFGFGGGGGSEDGRGGEGGDGEDSDGSDGTSRPPSELNHLSRRLRTFTPKRMVFPMVEKSKALIRGLTIDPPPISGTVAGGGVGGGKTNGAVETAKAAVPSPRGGIHSYVPPPPHRCRHTQRSPHRTKGPLPLESSFPTLPLPDSAPDDYYYDSMHTNPYANAVVVGSSSSSPLGRPPSSIKALGSYHVHKHEYFSPPPPAPVAAAATQSAPRVRRGPSAASPLARDGQRGRSASPAATRRGVVGVGGRDPPRSYAIPMAEDATSVGRANLSRNSHNNARRRANSLGASSSARAGSAAGGLRDTAAPLPLPLPAALRWLSEGTADRIARHAEAEAAVAMLQTAYGPLEEEAEVAAERSKAERVQSYWRKRGGGAVAAADADSGELKAHVEGWAANARQRRGERGGGGAGAAGMAGSPPHLSSPPSLSYTHSHAVLAAVTPSLLDFVVGGGGGGAAGGGDSVVGAHGDGSSRSVVVAADGMPTYSVLGAESTAAALTLAYRRRKAAATAEARARSALEAMGSTSSSYYTPLIHHSNSAHMCQHNGGSYGYGGGDEGGVAVAVGVVDGNSTETNRFLAAGDSPPPNVIGNSGTDAANMVVSPAGEEEAGHITCKKLHDDTDDGRGNAGINAATTDFAAPQPQSPLTFIGRGGSIRVAAGSSSRSSSSASRAKTPSADDGEVLAMCYDGRPPPSFGPTVASQCRSEEEGSSSVARSRRSSAAHAREAPHHASSSSSPYANGYQSPAQRIRSRYANVFH